jgi:four helix bundle protein
MPFSFENLTVYQRSLKLVEEVEVLATSLRGKASFSILDQLCRAALSVPLNIAEGSGRWHKKEKKQFLRVAKGSVFEMVPVFQVLKRKGLLSESGYARSYGELESMAKMLTGLEKSIDALENAAP